MSFSLNLGAVFGAVVGGVIGFYLGGPAGAVQGAAIGYSIGAGLNPPTIRSEGPRLIDKRAPGASYGTPISDVFGTQWVRGFLLWAVPIYERTSQIKQGDNTITVYTPYFKGAFLLCNGPIDGGVQRVKADGRVVFDNGTLSVNPIASGVPASSGGGGFRWRVDLSQYKAKINSSAWTFYNGTDIQLPDPQMESDIGAGKTPAYRGRAYVAMRDLNLTEFGKRIPLFEFKVVRRGTIDDVFESPFLLSMFAPDTGEPLGIQPPNGCVYVPGIDSLLFITSTDLFSAGGNPADGLQLQAIHPLTNAVKYDISRNMNPQGTWCFDPQNNVFFVKNHNDLTVFTAATGDARLFFNIVPALGTFVLFNINSVALNSARDEVWYTHGPNIKVCSKASILLGLSPSVDAPAGALLNTISLSFWGGFDDGMLVEIPHRQWMVIIRRAQDEMRIFDSFGNAVSGNIALGLDQVASAYCDTLNDSLWYVRNFRYLERFSFATMSVAFVKDLTNGVVGENATSYIDIDAEFGCAIVYNDITNKIEWIDGTGTVTNSVNWSTYRTSNGVPSSINYIPIYGLLAVRYGRTLIKVRVSRTTITDVPISEIVSDRAQAAGVPLSAIDVTEITETIGGIQYEGMMQARDQISPLRAVGLFDLCVSDGKLKAKKRGGAAVKTISYLDLVQPEDGSNPIETAYTEDNDVPAIVEVSFQDVAADGEISTQGIIKPIDQNGTIVKSQLPMLLTAAQARRAAEIIMYTAENGRRSVRLPTYRKHIDIERYDPFNFEWPDGTITRMMAVNVEFQFPMLVTIDAVEDDSSIIGVTAIGVSSAVTASYPLADAGIQVEFLDIPIQRDADNFPGFYVRAGAASSTVGDVYVKESVDGGVTFLDIGSIPIGPMGFANTALANFTAAPSWDYVRTVDVTVGINDTLESYTEAQVYSGLGAAMLGLEEIQYMTATLLAPRQYRLSNLLRGRRGTEWAVNTHTVGERFIPLPLGMSRVASTTYNVARIYRVTDISGNVIATQYFTNLQIGMKPFSPSVITGTRDGSNNLTISCVRRSRVGSAWGPTVDIPLGEDTERFEVDIMSGVTVKRTLTFVGPFAGNPSVVYSAANQTSDGFTPGQLILVNIYQLSSLVGRGYVGVATV